MTQGGGADLRGDGDYMMKIRRVLPDFLQQTGDARVTLNLKNYPTDSQAVHLWDLLRLQQAQQK